MKTVFFESLCHKLITKNDFYYGCCPVIHRRWNEACDAKINC